MPGPNIEELEKLRNETVSAIYDARNAMIFFEIECQGMGARQRELNDIIQELRGLDLSRDGDKLANLKTNMEMVLADAHDEIKRNIPADEQGDFEVKFQNALGALGSVSEKAANITEAVKQAEIERKQAEYQANLQRQNIYQSQKSAGMDVDKQRLKGAKAATKVSKQDLKDLGAEVPSGTPEVKRSNSVTMKGKDALSRINKSSAVNSFKDTVIPQRKENLRSEQDAPVTKKIGGSFKALKGTIQEFKHKAMMQTNVTAKMEIRGFINNTEEKLGKMQDMSKDQLKELADEIQKKIDEVRNSKELSEVKKQKFTNDLRGQGVRALEGVKALNLKQGKSM